MMKMENNNSHQSVDFEILYFLYYFLVLFFAFLQQFVA